MKAQMEGAKIAITWAQKEVKPLKSFKSTLEGGLQKLLLESSNKLDNPALSGWKQAASMVNMLAAHNMSLATSLIPVTNGEIGLLCASWFKTPQAVKLLQAIHPAKFLSWSTRLERTSIVPIQEIKLLPAPKMVKHHVFNQFKKPTESSSKYREFFKQHKIDIDAYTIEIPETFHRSQIHIAGNDWTRKWKQWIDYNPQATTKDVYQFAGSLMDEYNVSHLPLVKYK